MKITRRLALGAAAAALALAPLTAPAQDVPELTFSAVFTQNDIRAEMMEKLKTSVADMADLQLYYGGTLFAQGTELVAIQRGNLSMSNVAPQDIAKQIPAFSILTAAYLFRDADHLKTFFASEAGAEMVQMAEEQLGIHILGPTYFGTRQVNLKSDKKITTPEDMAGVKLRMPGGDAWQFLGESLGANPTPMPYSEVYTGLQSGAIDGQDNPFPNVENMKFYEVTDQIVLTSHLVAFDLLVISQEIWSGMTDEQRAAFQAAADEAIDWSTEQHLAREAELAEFFKGEGLEIYEPDLDAFRSHAQQKYLESDLSADWPEGMLDRINGL
ncbi:TRAP transporter substrate-binding protein DctP [Oceanicola sp. 502str15]|uniref:TRAP transporter substrate-binding protein DctP n=1 Tax=Oceanicola sp. 502str15 TaxID=2696061 RepID=UPI002095F740|nr:TRAP transporter substrate-binding protein DctP [Oceanicola sp. 502str15]MCO6384398.1 C4-dicarboxylate ABC transporter [Oceanicola sp. 502str15]